MFKAMIGNIGEGKLDWLRTNVEDWTNVIGVRVDRKNAETGAITSDVSPRSNGQAFEGTIKFLRDRSGLTAHLNKLSIAGQEEPADEESVEE